MPKRELPSTDWTRSPKAPTTAAMSGESVPDPALSAKAAKDVHVGGDAPIKIVDADVLVRGVATRAPIGDVGGRAQPRCADETHQRREQREAAGDQRLDGWLGTAEGSGEGPNALDEWVVDRRESRVAGAEDCDPDVSEATDEEVAPQGVLDAGRGLVGNQTKVHLGEGRGRKHGFDALTAVAGDQAGDVAGWGEGPALAERNAGEIVDETVDTVDLAHLCFHADLAGQRLALARRGRPYRLVETGYLYPAVRAVDSLQRLDQPPGSARQNSSSSRVRVGGHAAHRQLDVEHALGAQAEYRPIVRIVAPTLPEAGIGLEKSSVRLDDLLEVRAADLLGAFDDPADGNRQFTVLVPQGVNRGQACRDLPLVVGHTSGVELAVAHLRFKGWGLPELDRLRRLHVVVVVEQ